MNSAPSCFKVLFNTVNTRPDSKRKLRTLGQIDTEIDELKRKVGAIEDVLKDYAAGDQRLTALMK